MATKKVAKKPAKKVAKKAPAKKSAVKKVAQKTSKAPTKRVDAVSSARQTAAKMPSDRKGPIKKAATSQADPGCMEVAQLMAKFLAYAPYLGKGGDKLEATDKAELQAAAKTVLKSAQDKSLYHGQIDREAIADELLKLKVLPPETTKEDTIALLDQLDVGHVPGQEHPLAGLFNAVFPGFKF